MWLTLLAVAVGLVAGVVSGGSVATIGRTRPNWASLALIWLALTAVTRWVEIPGSKGLFLGANVAALMFCAVNIRRLGTTLLFCGVALNTAVIALNGAMPYRVSSVISAGLATSASDFPQTVQTRPQLPGDLLTGLSDVIPVNAGFIHDVLSVGDIVAGLGIAWVVYRSLQRVGSGATVSVPAPLASATSTLTSNPAPVSASLGVGSPNRFHVSKIRLGEEFDLLDDEMDATGDDSDRTADRTADHIGKLVDSVPSLASSSLSSSPISFVVDLTVDRLQHPHRHAADNTLGASALMARVLGIDTDEDIDILDISEGEVPGSLFWAERTRLLARSSAQTHRAQS